MNNEQFLSQEFVKAHPSDAARILEDLQIEDIVHFLSETPAVLTAKIVRFLSPLSASGCLNMMTVNNAADIINELKIDIAAALLRRLDAVHRESIFKILPDHDVSKFELLLKYPENTAGALMNPQVFTLFNDVTVKKALRLILRNPKQLYYNIPVLSREQTFIGLANIRNIIGSKAEELVSNVVQKNVGSLSPKSYRDVILAHPDWKIYHDLPVVDKNGIFLGLITYQTLHSLDSDTHKSDKTARFNDTGRALGELYWIGLSALYKGTTSIINPKQKPK